MRGKPRSLPSLKLSIQELRECEFDLSPQSRLSRISCTIARGWRTNYDFESELNPLAAVRHGARREIGFEFEDQTTSLVVAEAIMRGEPRLF
jgi:hypothetical protein